MANEHTTSRQRARRLLPLLGLLAGGIVGSSTVVVVGSAIAQRPAAIAPVVFEATHFPPLLVVPGERIELEYGVHCAPAGVEDPEQGCGVAGSVFAREPRRGSFQRIPLAARVEHGLRTLTASVPEEIASNRDGFEYYAELESPDGGRRTVPSGGAEAPYRVYVLADPVEVDLGRHAFGTPQGPDERVVTVGWGDAPADVGLEEGRNLPPIGASSFDVDTRKNVVLLDQAHRRLLQWERGASKPIAVPVSVDGVIADLALAGDGSVYVLESVGRERRQPLIRRFDVNGRELDAVEAGERTPSQIRIGPDGPVVLQQPSNQWMPVAIAGEPVSPTQQRRGARSGRPLRGGGEVVVLQHDGEVRVALTRNGEVRSSWRVTSGTPLAEVQLAEPVGQRLVLVVRVYSVEKDEFEVVVLDRRGIARRFATASADWAETAPLGRFRLVGTSLYRLGSAPSGAFVDRFELEDS
jgi:hypothetical protein